MNDTKKAIELFTIVRDIPYRIPLNEQEANNTCHGKSKLLCDLLNAYGFTARLRACSFFWSKLPLPEQLKKLIKEDKGFHTFVELELNGKWIVLDPSFDK